MDSSLPGDSTPSLSTPREPSSPTRLAAPGAAPRTLAEILRAVASGKLFRLFAFDDVVRSAIVHGSLAIFFVLTVWFELTIVDLAMWTIALAMLVAALARSLRSMGVIGDSVVDHSRISLPRELVLSVETAFSSALTSGADSLEAAFADTAAPVDGLVYRACAIIFFTAFSSVVSLEGLMTLWLLGLGFANAYRLAQEAIDNVLDSLVQPHIVNASKVALDVSNNAHEMIRTAPRYLLPGVYGGFVAVSFLFNSFIDPFFLLWILSLFISVDGLVQLFAPTSALKRD